MYKNPTETGLISRLSVLVDIFNKIKYPGNIKLTQKYMLDSVEIPKGTELKIKKKYIMGDVIRVRVLNPITQEDSIFNFSPSFNLDTLPFEFV